MTTIVHEQLQSLTESFHPFYPMIEDYERRRQGYMGIIDSFTTNIEDIYLSMNGKGHRPMFGQ